MKTLILHGEGAGEGDPDSPGLLSPKTGMAQAGRVPGSWFDQKILVLGQSLEQGRADALTMPRSVFHIRDWQSSVILCGGYFP